MDKESILTKLYSAKELVLQPRLSAAKISAGYLLAALLWILFSDRLVTNFTHDPEMIFVISSIKGILFVLVTSWILYLLVYGQLRRVGKAQSQYLQSIAELENAHEKLLASDEVLQRQYDELNVKTKELSEKESEIRALFENMHDAFADHEIVLDEQGHPVDYRFLIVNPAYEALVGRKGCDLIGHKASELDPVLSRDFYEACYEVALKGTNKRLTIFSTIVEKYLSIAVYSSTKGHFAILARDISDEFQHAQTVERLAYYDRLTGLPNREKLTEILNEELKTAPTTSGTLLYIDLDDLKLVNDSYGHSYGDAIIVTAAMHLVSFADRNYSVARLGGDEFVFLIPGVTDPVWVEQLATDLVNTLNQDYEVRELQFHVSASIGIVMYPQDGRTVEELLRNADTALYEAKRNGKCCLRFFRQSMQETAFSNMLLINGLRNALTNQELSVVYQPQLSLHDGKVIGFETLLRWNSSQYGNISPARFIPLAEKSHLIVSIGAWVVEKACDFSSQLTGSGYPGIRVAVNVSPRQLGADDFIQIIKEACIKSSIESRCLEIEVTESVFMESIEDSAQKLNQLRSWGVHLSLDDFGTGYSSLTYLRNLPVQTVKIDKSFIDLIAMEPKQADLIASIVDMAHVLGMSVVAEGVETLEQMERLIQCDCDIIQGYLVSKPVPEAVAMDFLKDDHWSEMINNRRSRLLN